MWDKVPQKVLLSQRAERCIMGLRTAPIPNVIPRYYILNIEYKLSYRI